MIHAICKEKRKFKTKSRENFIKIKNQKQNIYVKSILLNQNTLLILLLKKNEK